MINWFELTDQAHRQQCGTDYIMLSHVVHVAARLFLRSCVKRRYLMETDRQKGFRRKVWCRTWPAGRPAPLAIQFIGGQFSDDTHVFHRTELHIQMAEWRINASVNWATIGSDGMLSPCRRQAISWTIAELLLIEPLGKMSVKFESKDTNFIQWNGFENVVCKMMAILYRPQILKDYLNVINQSQRLELVNVTFTQRLQNGNQHQSWTIWMSISGKILQS